MERVMGIGPTQPAWKAGVLPLNYTRTSHNAMTLYQKRFLLSNTFRAFLPKKKLILKNIKFGIFWQKTIDYNGFLITFSVIFFLCADL